MAPSQSDSFDGRPECQEEFKKVWPLMVAEQPTDEATHVPMLVKGPGVAPNPSGITAPTSHVDLIPTLMGLAGIDVEAATADVQAITPRRARCRDET